jgi:hypothetical protein
MGSHPLNLAIRFLLEVTALAGAGMWGWKQSDSWFRFIMASVIPLLLATVWGLFAVPDDPSRSGKAPITIPGLVRLILELAIFGFSTWSLYDLGYIPFSITFGVVVVTHYAISYDRIIWLLSK